MNTYTARGGLGPGRPATRSGFGSNWWARRWLEALEAFGWENRLRRGRAYARAGQVRSIDVQPGRVDARVKGSRPQPYSVHIGLPPLSNETWDRVADTLASQARYSASLLAGEMPVGVEEAFASVGARLFPQPGDDLRGECSCPDQANPCKHIAALHYVLGSEFDRDPFLLFRLRGRTREALGAALRSRRASGGSTTASPGQASGTADTPPLAASLDRFWSLGDGFGSLRFDFEGPRVPEAILKRLGSPTDNQDGEVSRTELGRLYRTIAERALHSAYADNGDG